MQQQGRLELFRMENRVSFARLDYGPADIYLYLDSKYSPSRIRACSKEPWTVSWLERWLSPGDVVWDVGANIGAYAFVAASRHRGDVRVVAVEPAHATFSALCDNIVLNNLEDVVIPVDVALGAATGLGVFNYRDLEAGAGLHSIGDRRSLKEELKPVYRRPVLVYSLDDLLAGFDLPPPNHLKIDVDGAELDVLGGAANTLGSSGVRTVMIEVNEEAETLAAVLRGHGLELHERFDPPSPHGHWYGLFVRNPGAG
jgi:FkbM family methyltransferase